MNLRALKAMLWLALIALASLMAANTGSGWFAYSMALSTLIVLIILAEFEEKSRDPRTVAVTGVLVAIGVASRQILHGIEFSPVFFIVIISGNVFGFTTGFAVGALTMFVSNFFLGHGPWTPFQMLGMGLLGGFASFTPRRLLTIYAVLAAFAYGVFTDLFSWASFIPTHTMDSFIGIAAAGMPANIVRAIGNIFFMTLFGPVFLKILDRFRKRLSHETLNAYDGRRGVEGGKKARREAEEDGSEVGGKIQRRRKVRRHRRRNLRG